MSAPLSPDEECGVCGAQRDQHGDKQHQFNLDGQLIPLKPAEPPRQTPPRERGSMPAPSGVEEQHKAFLRLNEVLLEKGVINGQDLIRILGGPTS